MTMTYNGCIGHGGFGGQYMLADPQSETVVVFFSVLETIDAGDNILGARENAVSRGSFCTLKNVIDCQDRLGTQTFTEA